MADQEDQTAVRVSGGVIYGEIRVRSDVCKWLCVWPHGAPDPSLPPLSNHRGGFMATAGRL